MEALFAGSSSNLNESNIRISSAILRAMSVAISILALSRFSGSGRLNPRSNQLPEFTKVTNRFIISSCANVGADERN